MRCLATNRQSPRCPNAAAMRAVRVPGLHDNMFKRYADSVSNNLGYASKRALTNLHAANAAMNHAARIDPHSGRILGADIDASRSIQQSRWGGRLDKACHTD